MGSARRSPKSVCLAFLSREHFPGGSLLLTLRYPPASSGREPRTILGLPPAPSPSPQPSSPPLPRRDLSFDQQAAAAYSAAPQLLPQQAEQGRVEGGGGTEEAPPTAAGSLRRVGAPVRVRLPGLVGACTVGVGFAAPAPRAPVLGGEATGEGKGRHVPAGRLGRAEAPAEPRGRCGSIPAGRAVEAAGR